MFATKVTVSSGFFVNRVQQIQHLNQAIRAQVEELAHQQGQLLRRHFFSTERFHHDRGRFSHADCVGNLNLTAISQTSGNNVFRDVTGCIGCGTVNFRRILTRECTAAVTRHAAVGINDDFTTCQSTVAHWTADYETTGWVDEELGRSSQPFSRQYRLDDLFHNGFLQRFLIDVFRVLSRQNNRINTDDFAVVILEGNLAFCIRTQPG